MTPAMPGAKKVNKPAKREDMNIISKQSAHITPEKAIFALVRTAFSRFVLADAATSTTRRATVEAR